MLQITLHTICAFTVYILANLPTSHTKNTVYSCQCDEEAGQRCDIQTGTCECDYGHFALEGYNSSVVCQEAHGSDCVKDSECRAMNLSNSVCTRGGCYCRQGFFYPAELHRTQCYEAFGSTCRISEECNDILLHSTCREGFCRCVYGYYYVNSSGGCITVYDSQCTGHIDCTIRGGGNYQCNTQGVCNCVDGAYLNIATQTCQAVSGSDCLSHEDCLDRGAEGSFICSAQGYCQDPCSSAHCSNNSTCTTDEDSYRGYKCLCVDDLAGLSCAYPSTTLVVTKLKINSLINISTQQFTEMISGRLVESLVFGLCRDNGSCATLKLSQLRVEMISVDRTANNTTASLTYIVLEQSPVSMEYMPRSADDVTSVISMLSSSEMGQRMGYNVLLPARAFVQGPPPSYCQIRWALQVSPHMSSPLSTAFIQNLEQRLGGVVYKSALDSGERSLLSENSITTKVLNTSSSSGALSFVFTAYNDGICLPAVSVINFIDKVPTPEITPIVGFTPAAQPQVANFAMDSYIYSQNSFILKTMMPVTHSDVYFALSWARIEAGLTRVFYRALEEYIDKLQFGITPVNMRIKRQASVPRGMKVQSKLLDIQRVEGTNVVELTAYTELGGVVLPIEHVLYYLNKVLPEDIAIQLEEVIPQSDFVRAYKPSVITETNSTDKVTNQCVNESSIQNTINYWTRTVMLIHAEHDVNTAQFSEAKRIMLTRLFLAGVIREEQENSNPLFTLKPLPAICVQMIGVRRLSYDTGHTELVYFVTLDGNLVSPIRLVKLSQYYLVQDVALTLGEVVDEKHTVEPYSQSLNQTAVVHTSGREFFLTFMENYVEADWPTQSNYSLRLYFTTCGSVSAKVVVEVPGYLPTAYTNQLTVHPDRENYIVLPTEMMIRGSRITNHAILVKSDLHINVIAMNRDYLSQDSTLIQPVNLLGMEYHPSTLWPGGTQSQIAVVAYKDTQVDIQLSRAESGVYPEVMIEDVRLPGMITLNSLEVLQLQVPSDLSGSRLTSTQPVAVFSGNIAASLTGLSRDHIYEQITPTNLAAGTSFVVPSLGFDDSSYPVIVKIISTQSDTIVSLPAHNRTVHIVNSAEKVTVELIERDGSLFLHSTTPVVVFVFTASAKNRLGDSSMIQLSPLSRQSDYYTITTPNSGYRNFLHYLTIHVETSHRDGLRINGVELPVRPYNWHTVLYTYPEISITTIKLEPGVYHIWHQDQNQPFMVYAFGVSNKETYAHQGGSCPADLRPLAEYFITTTTSTPKPAEATIASSTKSLGIGYALTLPKPVVTTLVRTTSHSQRSSTVLPPVQWVNRTTRPIAKVEWVSRTKATEAMQSTPKPQPGPTTSKVPSTQSTTSTTPIMTSTTTTPATTTVSTMTTKSPKQKSTSLPITITSTVDSSVTLTSNLTSSLTTKSSRVIPGAEHLLWLTLEGGSELSLDEQKSTQSLLSDLINQRASSDRSKRQIDVSSDKDVHIWRTEQVGNSTAVLFYVLDSAGNPVNSSEVIGFLNSDSVTKKLQEILDRNVTQPIEEYSKMSLGVDVRESAADNSNKSDDTKNKFPVWPIILAVVLGLLVVVVLVVITVMSVKKKRDEKKNKDNLKQQELSEQKNALALPGQSSSGFGGGGDTLKLPVIHSSNQDVNNPTELKQPSGNTGQEKPAVCPLKEGEMQEGGEAGDGGEAVETMRQDDDRDVDDKFITQPDYPMSLSSEKIDALIAPYLNTNKATRNEIHRNKKRLRNKNSPDNGRRAGRRSDYIMDEGSKKKRSHNKDGEIVRSKHRHQQEPVTESSVSAAYIRHRGSQGKSKESKKVSSKSAAGEVGADGKQSLTHPTDHPTDTDVRETKRSVRKTHKRCDVTKSGNGFFKSEVLGNKKKKYKMRHNLGKATERAARSAFTIQPSAERISRISKSAPDSVAANRLNASSSANSLPGSVLVEK